MADNWRTQYFQKKSCEGVILKDSVGNIQVNGTVNSETENPTILYWASNSADRHVSYSGSGLPFASPEQAYENSKNVGAVKANNRKFSFNINMPNSYYVGLGSLYVPPHIHFKVCEPNSSNQFHTIKLGEGIPYRTLTYPAPPSKNSRVSPMFYENRGAENYFQVRSQEQILRDSGYPSSNQTPDNFWGLKPAQ